jgi:small-conductance mechanosensitive channel
MISIGSSSFIANMIAGYALTFRRAFTLGEWIELGGTYGEVMQTRLQVTHLRTPKNEEVIIPNSTILTSPVTNYSKLAHERGLILHTSVHIGYETPWRQVEAMLLMAAQRTPSVARDPPPFVLQRKLGTFAVEYELNVYCNDASLRARALSELHRNILDVFNEHGVQIMTPAYEGDPKQPKVVASERRFSPTEPTDAASLLRDLQSGARNVT